MDTATINNLRLCLKKIEVRDKAKAEYFRARKTVDAIRESPSLEMGKGDGLDIGVIACVSTGFLLHMVSMLLLRFDVDSWGSFLVDHLLSVYGAFIIISIISGIILGKIGGKLSAKGIQRRNEELLKKHAQYRRANEPKALQQLDVCAARLRYAEQQVQEQAQTINLHRYYQNENAVESIISLLETGRSDTLKEAINLYEQERREDARDRADFEHRRQMQHKANAIYEESLRGREAAESAARSAEEAALWGAAATFLSATNTKKQDSDDYRVI